MLTPGDGDGLWMQDVTKQPQEELYKQIHLKTLQINQNGIINNAQITHKKAGKTRDLNGKLKSLTYQWWKIGGDPKGAAPG